MVKYNSMPRYLKVIFFVFALTLLLSLCISFSEAKTGTFDKGSWKMRYDTTKTPYGCSAAPGGTVKGNHINFEIYNKAGSQLFNLHIWLDYLPKVYISDGPFCKKLDKTTFKKTIEAVKDYLKKKMSNVAIAEMMTSISKVNYDVLPIVILVPNCNNPPAWDLYSKAMCAGLGNQFQYAAA